MPCIEPHLAILYEVILYFQIEETGEDACVYGCRLGRNQEILSQLSAPLIREDLFSLLRDISQIAALDGTRFRRGRWQKIAQLFIVPLSSRDKCHNQSLSHDKSTMAPTDKDALHIKPLDCEMIPEGVFFIIMHKHDVILQMGRV
ncbi:hypothetical protein AVEN_207313-1 [Araneus ventricosus]|uniref:Uncharacterized protein n=1 Tax=Araneus ventricosus TaxID=182803 RepID=A0A4Y2Q337_ARAVE|nr:hypothetical protein AVEN_207313-1 [Araneus ventricosus]